MEERLVTLRLEGVVRVINKLLPATLLSLVNNTKPSRLIHWLLRFLSL